MNSEPESVAQAGAVPGTVWWLTGLAGAGKTVLAERLVEVLREAGRVAVLLDGDELRARLFPGVGHSGVDRRALARRYGELADLVARQGPDVVCATISLFPEVHADNRERFASYREVLVRAPREVRAARKPAVYGGASGPVAGEDLAVSEPSEPHATVDNDGARPALELARELWDRLR